MRVALDATPLLGPRTGVGQYTARLTEGLGRRAADEELNVRLIPFTLRGTRGLQSPIGTEISRRRFPARLLQQLWARTDFPPVELFSGRTDVFHATNFVLPPRRRAAGVVTIHDLTFLRHPSTVTSSVSRYQVLVPRSVSAADVVVCPARSTAEDVAAEYQLDPAKVRVTPLGVENAWFHASPPNRQQLIAMGLPERYFLFVGTREPRKDLSTLVTAHDRLVRVDSTAPHLVLAGPAGWGEQPESAPHRFIVDYLAMDDLRCVVAGATALVMPSRYEGFGLPLLEGLACGIPVIASDLPVHREVAGTYATYVPVGDIDELVSALSRVANDEYAGVGNREASEERRRWAARWSWEVCVEATLDSYRQAVSVQ